jgi:cation diffusion facilitator CzcD-associated flavoprotein CzcO
MLGVDALIIDRNEHVGDNWRQRYHQLVLHDPVWYDHLPYINFPAKYVYPRASLPLSEFLTSWSSSLLILIQLAHIYAKGQARRIF